MIFIIIIGVLFKQIEVLTYEHYSFNSIKENTMASMDKELFAFVTSYTVSTDEPVEYCVECVKDHCEGCPHNDKKLPCHGCTKEECGDCIPF